MTPGDFCFVPRDDGRFALFIYLCQQGKSRSYFYGALATAPVSTNSPEAIPISISVGDHALIHIQCYRKNGTPICGNLADRLPLSQFDNINTTIHNTEIGVKHKVWGYKTIIKYANQIHS